MKKWTTSVYPMKQATFKQEIRKYYKQNKRDFSWRQTHDPYRILVSEIMLQQTQTYRVEPKYREFIKKFPSFQALAKASIPAVLSAWQGLGYNRRALYLKKTAEVVITKHKGKLPSHVEKLRELPGIGPNTAGSIMAFAFDKPTVFIETNIRRVFIHFFFADQEGIDDRDILELVSETLDRRHSREWYFALMDYGAMLAKKVLNPNRHSKQYAIQSKFSGSDREVRGLILKMLLRNSQKTSAFVRTSGRNPETIRKILAALKREGFIVQSGGQWRLAS